MPNVSKNVLLAAGAAIVSIVAITILAWWSVTAPAPTPPQRPATAALDAGKPPDAVSPATAPSSPDQKTAGASPAAAQPPAPSFDVVRVEPSGDTVIAGRAAPGSTVTLMASGKPAGTATANDNGQFVIIAEPLKPGAQELSLAVRGPAGEQQSLQSVAVSVPQKGTKEEVIVALAEPGKPTQILSDPRPATSPPTAKPPAAASEGPQGQGQSDADPPSAGAQKPPAALSTDRPPVAFRTVEVEQGSGFFASGSAAPGAQLRIYLNDAHVADVTANDAGQWSIRITRGLPAGKYAVRADQIDPSNGSVLSRAEVPFAMSPQVAAVEPVRTPRPPVASDAAPSSGQTAPAAQTAPSAPSAGAPLPAGQPPAASTTVVASPAPGQAASPQSAPPPVASPASRATAPAFGEKPESVAAALSPADPSNVTIDQVPTATVVRGDSLWRISRKMLGRGIRYTQIYDANTSQIRDPRRIYPGQVLVVPKDRDSPAKSP